MIFLNKFNYITIFKNRILKFKLYFFIILFFSITYTIASDLISGNFYYKYVVSINHDKLVIPTFDKFLAEKISKNYENIFSKNIQLKNQKIYLYANKKLTLDELKNMIYKTYKSNQLLIINSNYTISKNEFFNKFIIKLEKEANKKDFYIYTLFKASINATCIYLAFVLFILFFESCNHRKKNL